MKSDKTKRRFKYDWDDFNYAALSHDHIDKLTLDMIDPGSTVLELGAATGYHTSYLTHYKKCRVTAVDLSEKVKTLLKKVADKVVIGDIDDQSTWDKISKHGPFDVVLASNVIEHLVDPWKAFERIHSVLKKNGSAVVAVPNIAFWRARLKLLQGVWQYEEYGIFDKTHTKFFTVDSLRQDLEKAGFQVTLEAYDPAGGAKFLTPLLKLFPNAYAHQVVMKAVKR